MDELTSLKERVEVLEHVVDEHGKLVVRLSHQLAEVTRLMRRLTIAAGIKPEGEVKNE